MSKRSTLAACLAALNSDGISLAQAVTMADKQLLRVPGIGVQGVRTFRREHPLRLSKVPTPEQVAARRLAVGWTQVQAGHAVYRTKRAWQHWEAGTRPMDLACWELFLRKTEALDDE